MEDGRETSSRRRAQAVAAGLAAFADHGLTTRAVHKVAEQMGVSQTYVFRLFGSKQAFFLACIDELEARILGVFVRAVEEGADSTLEEMGVGFRALVSDGTISGFWFQACAAARADDAIAHRCREVISNVLHLVQSTTSAGASELAAFFGRGALVMMLQTLRVDMSAGSQAAVASLVDDGRVS